MGYQRRKRKFGRSAVCLIGAVSCLAAALSGGGVKTAAGQVQPSDGTGAFVLTEAESEYLEELRGRKLILGVPEASGWSGEGGSEYGAAVPVAELLLGSFGLDVEVACGSWESLKSGLREGSVDFLFGVPVPDRDGTLQLSEAELFCAGELYQNPRLLVVRAGEPPSGLYEGGQRIGLVRAEAAAELFAPWLERTAEPVYYADAKQLFDAVASGEADAALITGSMAAELYPYRELTVGGVLGQLSRGGTIGTAKRELEGVIGLLDRFLQTAEGEALRTAVQEQQGLYEERLIAAEEQEVLTAVGQKYSALRFVWDGADSSALLHGKDGEPSGRFSDFFEFVTACTGLEITVTESVESSAPEGLLGGEAELAVGLSGGDWGGEELCSFGISETELVAVIPSEAASGFSAEHVPNLYWGAAADTFSYLEGTVFDGHAIAFEREAQLLPALSSGQVGGILLCRETAEYAVLEDEAGRLRILPDFSFPVQRVFLFRPGDEVLCGLMERLYHAWLSREGRQKERAAQLRLFSEYSALGESEAHLKKEVLFWRIAGPALLAVLFVLRCTAPEPGRAQAEAAAGEAAVCREEREEGFPGPVGTAPPG